MKEYIRRQRKHIWLETHIWHAKRFHMSELWGYKIPYSPCDKRYRAAYKAISKHCLLNDISFINAIEISGPLEILKEKFSRLSSPETGLSITAKAYLSGCREGSVDLFKIDSYPLEAIGKVSVLWKPAMNPDEKIRSVWIFAHPTIYQKLVEEFIVLFNLENFESNVEADTQEEKPESGKKKKRELQLKFITRKSSIVRYPVYCNENLGIKMTELKDTLNRFRLSGPLSTATLQSSFKIASNLENTWIKSWLQDNPSNKEAFENQQQFWESLKSTSLPSEVPPHMVFALNIVDPRTNRPTKRQKPGATENFNQNYIEIPEFSSHSSIWERSSRDDLIKNLMPTQRLCELRNREGVVPGVPCQFENDLQPTPILLVQRPGCQKRLGFGGGWDLIVPAGYGMSCWLNLIYNGAKSGGWRELLMEENECGRDYFLPDSLGGISEDERIGKMLREKYFKLPPNKRQNYRKLGIASPFYCPFKQLNREWSGQESYFVLRNKEILNSLTKCLNLNNKNLPNLPKNCLVPIAITILHGSPENNSIICLPTKKDCKKFAINKFMRDKTPILTEPLQKDPDELARKSQKFNHKKLLKKLRNRRVRAKRKLQKHSKKFVKIEKSDTEKLVEEQFQKMCEMLVPTKPESIRNQCSRETIGYLTNSRFTYSEANVCAVGYLMGNGFVELIKSFCKLKTKELFVLVRSPNSRHYQIGFLKIRIDL